MKHNQAPQQKNYERLGYDFARVAEERPDSCIRKLSAGANKPPFSDVLAREPLVSQEHYSGKQEEGLTHLVVVGNSILGISRNFNHPRGSENFGQVESVRISVLPLGEAAAHMQSSRTLLEVHTATLRNPRENGVIQGWESIAIGRKELADATGVVDQALSRQHLEIAVTADGNVGITDRGSTYGTQILSMDDFGYNGLTPQGQQMLEDTRQELQQKPYMWNNQFADTVARIVDPHNR